MACGIPIIAKRDECLTGVLIDGKNGYGFDTEEELIDAVMKYYNLSPEEKLKMKEAALAKADEYSTENFAKNVLKVYYQAIKNGRKGQNIGE